MMFNGNDVLKIEINDQKIDSDICDLLTEAQDCISAMKTALYSDDITTKNKEIEELIEIFEKIASKTSVLIDDMKILQMKELNEKSFVNHQASEFLDNKATQLEVLKTNINTLVDIFLERPNIWEMKEEGLLDTIIEDLNKAIDAINEIVNDDKKLKKIFSS